ncbi:GNAT family N-acetyltransferase [Streptomyces sp. NPDC005388]|uniref:GNAT family N-acetyltransferase n=1 Tax=Streptomyces sp. NPDC005388 TaxID=3156717 RepID=UPI0033BEB8C1
MEPIRRGDSDDLFEAVVSQDGVMRWLATGRADSRSAARAMCDDYVAHWTRHGYGDFAVRDAATHAFLGRVGLRNRARHGVDLGFAVQPLAQGRGIAGEAGRACLDLAFRRLSLPAVFAFVLPDNTASIAVLRRLGAQADGTVQSSGLHCLRFRFDPAGTAAAEHVAVDDGGADLQLIHVLGPGSPTDGAALRSPARTRARSEISTLLPVLCADRAAVIRVTPGPDQPCTTHHRTTATSPASRTIRQ